MSKSNVVELNNTPRKLELDDVKVKTAKKYSKQIERNVRRLDNVLTDLNEIYNEILDSRGKLISTEISEKDEDRLTEMEDVVGSAVHILYHLTRRMSRKHVGKEIDPLDVKRKSLKL